jgi:hypothetical protein
MIEPDFIPGLREPVAPAQFFYIDTPRRDHINPDTRSQLLRQAFCQRQNSRAGAAIVGSVLAAF